LQIILYLNKLRVIKKQNLNFDITMLRNFELFELSGLARPFEFKKKYVLRYWTLILTVFLIVSLNSCNKEKSTSSNQIHDHIVLFDGGTSGFHSFRIPSIVKTKNGTLVAICENRRWSNSDYGDINIVYKRSTDNGNTWSSLEEIVGVGSGSWTNPTSVYDPDKGLNGRIWLFLSWNDSTHTSSATIDKWGDRKVYNCFSDDNGLSWSVPVDMTTTLLPSGYKWDAMGPGIGIRTIFSNPGRLIIPATSRNIYSDDNGNTWRYQIIPGQTSEGAIVEKLDGTLLRNDRPTSANWQISKRRWLSSGTIENGFQNFTPKDELLDPGCQGSILRFNSDSPNRIVLLNSSSIDSRGKMMVKISYDNGNTWPVNRRIYDWLSVDVAAAQGKGGYSSMIKTDDSYIGALIEINEDPSNSNTSHRSIEFHKFNLPWILNGVVER
jgi:sialidase-1